MLQVSGSNLGLVAGCRHFPQSLKRNAGIEPSNRPRQPASNSLHAINGHLHFLLDAMKLKESMRWWSSHDICMTVTRVPVRRSPRNYTFFKNTFQTVLLLSSLLCSSVQLYVASSPLLYEYSKGAFVECILIKSCLDFKRTYCRYVNEVSFRSVLHRWELWVVLRPIYFWGNVYYFRNVPDKSFILYQHESFVFLLEMWSSDTNMHILRLQKCASHDVVTV